MSHGANNFMKLVAENFKPQRLALSHDETPYARGEVLLLY